MAVLVTAGRAVALPLDVAGSTVAASLTASAASGLAAGWYPARRATHLDVITALRSE